MNNISIVGRLTRDVDFATTTSGVSVARFSVAVASEFKDADGNKKTDFFNCVAYRGLAETISKFFSKGQFIALTGSMNSRSYEDKNGAKQTVWEINVKGFSFCSNSESKSATNQKQDIKQITLTDVSDEDLPF
jgi:single-strand DNA-binding protein